MLDDNSMPWEIIQKITFYKNNHSLLIQFNSGNKIEATADDEDKWYEMIDEAILNLSHDKINFNFLH